MMDHPTFGNGKICYVEIPAMDISKSASFYAAVFGWQVRTRDDGTVGFDDGVGEVSGTWVTGRKPASDAGFMMHIMVNSISASIELIVQNGGLITPPAASDAPGATASFLDPAGNRMGLYQHGS
jgi:predicted enzyme related to lactoylglutathione lyase